MKEKAKILWIGGLISTVILIALVAFGVRALLMQPVTIAVVTSQSDPSYIDDGQALVNGAQLYVDQINRAGGVNGRKVKLQVFDDKGDIVEAVKIANGISYNPKIVAVIGHLFSNTSLAAGDVYQRMGVPVVTGTASAPPSNKNDWYFSVIPSNDSVGAFLANYSIRVLRQKNATIVYDSRDPYSASLIEGFVAPFKGLGGKASKYKFDLNGQDENETIEQVVNAVLHDPNGTGLIFVATQKDEAENLIVALRRKGITSPILGGDTLGSDAFGQRFLSLPEEQDQPGYFTNNIYASSPVIFDRANEVAQAFRNAYKQANRAQEPTWIAASSYDAAKVIVTALQQTMFGGQTNLIADQRRQLREYIAGLDSPEKALKGVCGDIYFGKQMEAVKPIVVGVFSEDKFISAPTQFSPITNLNLIPNLDQDLRDGHIVIMDGQYVQKTSVVYTGIEFNEISSLDEATSTYHMDFYIWFRYQGEVDATNIQFLNAVDDVSLDVPLQSKQLSDNINYQLFRVRGDFKSTFDFHSYPFDKQNMVVRFRHENLTRDNLVYVVDSVSIRPAIEKRVFLTGGDWKIDSSGTLFYPDSIVTNSSLGDPQLFGLNPDTEYATFNAVIPISRDVFSFILRNLLPVFFTLILTYMAYFLPSEDYATRSGLLSGSVLTIAFFHLGMSSSLKVGYTVALDYSFYACYAIILIGLSLTMLEWYLHTRSEKLKEQDDELHEKGVEYAAVIEQNEALIAHNATTEVHMRTTGRVFFPAALALVVGGYLLVYGFGVKFSWPSLGTGAPVMAALVEPTAIPQPETPASGKVVLTVGSWRVDDQTQMNKILAVFNAEHPNIEVKFSPVVGSKYESTLRIQLKNKTAPDLFYLSSAGGRIANPQEIMANSDIEPLTGLPGLENYAATAIDTWSLDGKPYGLPLYAVSHGIYYNVDLFERLELPVPQTWAELISTAEKLKKAGYIPFANGVYESDKQRIGDLIFTNLAPTFIGGAEGREKYATGQRCFNDPRVVSLFAAIQDISHYMPPKRNTLSYYESQQLFLQEQAAMYLGGSFEIPTFEKARPAFEWSVFAVPPPTGKTPYVNFHIDTAIALNAHSSHKTEARIFLEWLTTPQFASLLGDNLPGQFPLNLQAPAPSNPHGQGFLKLTEDRKWDVRWVLPNTGLPDGRTLMQNAALDVMQGSLTPQQAANQLQNGLAQWYLPAQQCLP